MLVRSFEDLDSWQAVHQLTLTVYRATTQFPREEMFGVTSQIRRAAVCVEANLAEGFGRRSRKEMGRFVRISDGSLQEVKCLLRLAHDLDYLDHESYRQLAVSAARIGSLLGGLQSGLNGV